MNQLIIAALVVLALTACMWASPGEDDITTCTNAGHSREVCIHSIMP